MSSAVIIVMLRSCLVAGEGRAEGQRVSVPLVDAHEAVSEGWARFENECDAPACRVAHARHVHEQVARLGRVGGSAAGPWARLA